MTKKQKVAYDYQINVPKKNTPINNYKFFSKERTLSIMYWHFFTSKNDQLSTTYEHILMAYKSCNF